MTTTSIHDSSKSITVQPVSASEPTCGVKTSIKTLAIAVPSLSFAGSLSGRIATMIMAESAHPVFFLGIVFDLVAAFMLPLIVMLLFQIGKRFRNPQSRWSIYLYAGLVFLCLQFAYIVSGVLKLLSLFIS